MTHDTSTISLEPLRPFGGRSHGLDTTSTEAQAEDVLKQLGQAYARSMKLAIIGVACAFRRGVFDPLPSLSLPTNDISSETLHQPAIVRPFIEERVVHRPSPEFTWTRKRHMIRAAARSFSYGINADT